MSRIQAGALSIRLQPVALHEMVPIALDTLGPAAEGVELDIPDSLPEIDTDPALLERVIANLTANALRYSPAWYAAAVVGQCTCRVGRATHRRSRARHTRQAIEPHVHAVSASR